jgi:hypothetical protein
MRVISTEAAHSPIVSSAAERPPHFAFAFACEFVSAVAVAAAFAFGFFSFPPQKCVISTEAAHSLIVSSAAERPPHFAFLSNRIRVSRNHVRAFLLHLLSAFGIWD